MGFFKFLRFKIRRRSKRVDNADDPKTAGIPNSPDSMDPLLMMKKEDFHSMAIKRFSWEEIQEIAGNFSSVIGEGGFSTVYLARLSHMNTLGALKIQRKSERLCRLFKQELEILLQIRHDNIVKLLGYCDEREEVALVFEYVSNGSLHDKLHDINGGRSLLSWRRRMLIAFQLAQAIDYLHSNCTLQIVHGDIKSSNVLLDDHLNCKLCDFGFAKMGFSSMVLPSSMSPLMGSPGYMDPHYLRTGIASKKNDVYSFGVIILELITGREAFCSKKEMLLTSIAGPVLNDGNNVAEMMDPRLAGDFQAEEANVMSSIAAQCLQHQPNLRLSMADVMGIMREKIASIP